MKVVKETNEYTIIKKRSGRYGVRGKNKTWINGNDKIKILLSEGLIKAPEPKAAEPEAAADETADGTGKEEDTVKAEEAETKETAPAAE